MATDRRSATSQGLHPHGHQSYDQTALAAQDPTGKLYNNDLKPADPEQRTWGAYSLFALWMNGGHNLGNYTFAAGLFMIGLSPIQVTIGILGGVFVIFGGCTLSGFMGHDTGAPYPVVNRLAWGIWGAKFPAIVRGIAAVVWYGVQTFLASLALKILLLRLIPSLESLVDMRFAGLDLLGWLAFIILWAIQMAFFAKGMEVIRHFQGWAGPGVWLVMLVLTGWMLWQANWSFSWTQGGGDVILSRGEQWYETFAAMGLTVGVLATLMLNFSDFARFAPSRKSVTIGNLFGLPLNFTAFALTSVVLSAASVKVYGEAMLDPAAALDKVDNTAIVLVGSVVFVLATVGVNIVANFVSAAYDISTLNPKRISFRTGGIIASFLALVVTPWNVYSSPVVINYFLGGLGALFGPFFGIMAVDYFILRKARTSIPDMYQPTSKSLYYYTNGTNRLAIAALIPAAFISLFFALAPVALDLGPLDRLAPFGWFVGAALGGLFYFLIARHRLAGSMADASTVIPTTAS